MKRHKSPIALLASCMLLTNGIRTDIPFSRCEPAETKTLSEFAAQLTQASDAAPHRELFCTLRFSGAEQQLYRDGEPVGRSYAGCRIENGGLVISTDGQNALTPQEAAEQIGCRVLEQDGDLTVTFPFQTAKLIVKAEQEPALHGGRLLASGFQDLYVVQFESQEAAYRAYQAYQQDPDVEFADCDSVLSAAEMHGSGTNALDSERTSWGVHDIGADDYCAWLTETKETLPEVCVAVVDTGVNAAHSWLNGRILPNGARFSEDAPGGWEDDFGHGTHCAGIIASCTMDNVKILPIKVLNREGMGTTLEIYCGVMYALEQGADVISMSLGGLGVSPLLNAAAAAASEQDVTFCVAAGNDSLDTKYDNVATAPDVIAVAALGSDHWCAGFSNRGAEIDFAAPGVKILSAISESTDATMLADGTSMATPFVAAAASDLLSYDPELSAEQIYEYLRANAKDLGDPGFDPYYGWGEVSLRDFRFSEKSCPAPVFSPKGGEYRNAQEITLECEADGKEPAAIYYTLDGSEPDPEHALLYTGEPVLLEQSATVKAAAVSGGVQSRTVSEAYCIGDTDTADALDIQDGVLAGYHGTRCRLYLDELVEDGSLKAIGAGAFAGNDSLIEVILPDSVTEIGERAFYECGSLEKVTGAGVRKIGTEAFCSCG
ncbi:MAG: S8 family serine peptidase, partial [Oscillospiraceae bacterium]|nr:S8 family serine peptidase [Oscillospiraceae bacterium]